MKKILLAILMVVWAAAGRADTVAVAAVDTVRFEVRQVIAPAAMVTAGALCIGIKPLVQARRWVNTEVGVHDMHHVDTYLQFLPAAAYLGLEYCGAPARRPIVDRAINTVTAGIICTVLTTGLKYAVREQRPDGSDSHSWPSGHTARAFMGAELLRQDYGPWVGAAGYCAASAVGVMRVCGGRHWLNDVVAGAGIGILSAKAAEWLLPFNRRWLGLDRRRGRALVLLPSYLPSERAACLSAAIIL